MLFYFSNPGLPSRSPGVPVIQSEYWANVSCVFKVSVAMKCTQFMTRLQVGLLLHFKRLYYSPDPWWCLLCRICHGLHGLKYFLILSPLPYAVPCPKDSGGGPGVLARIGEGHMETNLQVIASLLLDPSVGSEALQNPPGWSRELQPEAQFGGWDHLDSLWGILALNFSPLLCLEWMVPI